MRKLIFLLALLFAPAVFAAAGVATVTVDDDNAAEVLCNKGYARISAIDGGEAGGWDSTTITLEFKNSAGTWANACQTSTDCEFTADTGIYSFQVPGSSTWLHLDADTGTDNADIDVEIVCGNP